MLVVPSALRLAAHAAAANAAAATPWAKPVGQAAWQASQTRTAH